ncbi:Gfo/Idh/MocA family protein [Sulfitobacter geojensis]|uniref:Gfo/Idh/MocA family protein n=1 Tax=Sulfitobacter geojensis TaxID=1342299 RepID=UPI0004694081|nr:Gfo/Idh/MocA family oxidoreductase [Sulfitobacter geojensis]KHA53269.1 Oxidoreductase domain protein [Sulfitobacter geojensis]NYI28074.1 putative dehydrogenase [Sulfitobacter geojensis]
MTRFAGRQGPIRLGMVGGGQGAMIGAVHRLAARLDGHYELVAGALSSTAEKSRASAREVGLAPDRSYDDFKQMAIREARLKDGIEAVAIVTPNHMHLPVAREFLKRGIHVICDKPLTGTMSDAKKMQAAAEKSDALFVLTHNYSGYPMVREARALIASGKLGDIRLVQVEYAQDWLAEAPAPDNKQASWRTDPARSGVGGATGDIGTHAWQLAGFVTGLKPQALAADLQSFVPGRTLDDNAHVMLRFHGGARGMLWCSQVAAGEENGLRLRVYGSKAGLCWQQENPNVLQMTPLGGPATLLTRASRATGHESRRLTRIAPGHPEGFFEAFGNIYAEAAQAIRAHRSGAPVPDDVTFPGIEDGIAGVAFVDACVRSSNKNAAWVTL